MSKTQYAYSRALGRRVKVETLDTTKQLPRRNKPFKVKWVRFPLWWVGRLRNARASTFQLAFAVLAEAFKREYIGGDIVLSSEVTGMPRTTRMQAARELVELGLIGTTQKGHQATVVSHINYSYRRSVLKTERRVLKPERGVLKTER
jgi:hypothetical protein